MDIDRFIWLAWDQHLSEAVEEGTPFTADLNSFKEQNWEWLMQRYAEYLNASQEFPGSRIPSPAE